MKPSFLTIGLFAGTAFSLFSLLFPNSSPAAEANTNFSYLAYRFEPEERWRLRASGNPGDSKLEGRILRFDFSQGAQSIGLSLPDRVLLGRPEKLRLRLRGAIKGHPLEVTMHTHFMTFSKVVGEFTGEGEQEIVIDTPPGHDWKWHGGENDGKLHGPLRLGDLRFQANSLKDSGRLELVSLAVDGVCPAQHLCMLVAQFQTNAGPQFVAETRAASDRPLQGNLAWTVRDWDGNELFRGSRNVTVPAGGIRLNTSLPLPALPKELLFAEAEFALDIPGQVVPNAQAYWLAPVAPHDDPELRPESPFGMGVYLNRFGGRDQEAVARMARDAGVKWSREDFSWGGIEREPGKFEWAFHDRLVETARANGITIYAIVAYFPGWSKGYTSEGVDQYAAFLRHLVARYKGRIQQWEVWNEPNIFFWQGPKELYAECLIKSYRAIKETDPTAEVLGISTAGIDYKFIEQMLAKNTPFDILTIHPYRKTLDDSAFIADLKKASDLVKLPSGLRRPVWLTEMGWATHVPHHALRQDFDPNSQRAQAEFLARTYLCSIVSGVEPRTFWYNFRNDGDDPIYFEHNMGIMTRDLRPKPAYVAFAALTRILKGMQFAGQAKVNAPEGTFAYSFEPDPGARGTGLASYGQVLALWHPKQTAQVKIETSATGLTLFNTIGEGRLVRASNGSVEISLPSGKALYLACPADAIIHKATR